MSITARIDLKKNPLGVKIQLNRVNNNKLTNFINIHNLSLHFVLDFSYFFWTRLSHFNLFFLFGSLYHTWISHHCWIENVGVFSRIYFNQYFLSELLRIVIIIYVFWRRLKVKFTFSCWMTFSNSNLSYFRIFLKYVALLK